MSMETGSEEAEMDRRLQIALGKYVAGDRGDLCDTVFQRIREEFKLVNPPSENRPVAD